MNIEKILSELTFEEKATLLTGAKALSSAAIDRLGVSGIEMSDGPHGVRRLLGNPNCPQECHITGGDVCFPTASAVGSSWSRETAFTAGSAIALDCKEEGIDMLLAPAVNMKRLPNCGRNFEYYSEDPHLSGILGASFINGVQSEGVGTSLKHFAINNQEIERGTINVEIDEKTMREYYLKVFEILLKHCNPTSVMCAYNKINGIWCSENRYILTELLKEEWGYDGLVVSDWGAVHDITKCLKAGLDLQMPRNSEIYEQLKTSLDKGLITMPEIDRAVRKMLEFIDRINSMKKEKTPYNRENQHKKAYNAACECITLLRNDNNILPVTDSKYKKIAVFGNVAKDVLFMGGGSSKVSIESSSVDIPLDYIKKNADGITVDYYPIFENGFIDEGVVHRVNAVNQAYDAVLFFVGDNYGMDCETESFDRDNIKFPNYVNAAIEKAVAKFKNLVLILQTGSAVLPYRWEKVPAVIQMWYTGEAAGSAIADVLFGKVNPSGKLSETFIKKERTDLDYPGDGTKVNYSEKLNVGYRYYDKHPEDVWFPFGHGISYTTFEYSDMKINNTSITSDEFVVKVSLKVKNTGSVSGKEVVQLYIAPLDNIVERPIKELVGFDKIELAANEEKTVEFTLNEQDFAYYNICLHGWHVESGCYKIMAAASSTDIRLSETISVKYDTDYTKEKYDGSMII